MRFIIQRVKQATVSVAHKNLSSGITKGLLVFVGINDQDNKDDVAWMCHKLINLRIFEDHQNKMNLSVLDIKAEVLLISQFTLYANIKKGNRPSFTQAASPEIAIPIYEEVKETLHFSLQKNLKCGFFREHMEVSLINDGPVTIIIDSIERK